MLFAAKKPMSVSELKAVFVQAAEKEEAPLCRQLAGIRESDITSVSEQIKAELTQAGLGVRLVDVAGGLRLQTDPDCSPWMRQMLNSGRPARLSKPTLETLAIIAYRQPVSRSEIEAVRGVNVDSIVRHLMECQLIKIVGRSNLPGHPLLYGTTQLFLEHFGLESIDHLPGIEQLRRRDEEHVARKQKEAAESSPHPAAEPEAGSTPPVSIQEQDTAISKPDVCAGTAGGASTPPAARVTNDEKDDEDAPL